MSQILWVIVSPNFTASIHRASDFNIWFIIDVKVKGKMCIPFGSSGHTCICANIGFRYTEILAGS